jgi:hypothetical protein
MQSLRKSVTSSRREFGFILLRFADPHKWKSIVTAVAEIMAYPEVPDKNGLDTVHAGEVPVFDGDYRPAASFGLQANKEHLWNIFTNPAPA